MMFRPSRISSEAPEVVPQPSFPPPLPTSHEHLFLSPTWNEAGLKSVDSPQPLKETEEREVELKNFEPSPQEPYRPYAAESLDDQRRRGHNRRKLTTIALVVLAFLAGGGIGGGVGGSIAAKRSSTPASQPTITITSGTSNPTTIVDYAGCPSVNNKTYTPSGSSATFIKICTSEVITAEGQQSIDMGNSTESTLNACLDACAAREGCIGASWFIFSAAEPKRNSVCFFKNGTGQATPATGSGQQVASGVLQF